MRRGRVWGFHVREKFPPHTLILVFWGVKIGDLVGPGGTEGIPTWLRPCITNLFFRCTQKKKKHFLSQRGFQIKRLTSGSLAVTCKKNQTCNDCNRKLPIGRNKRVSDWSKIAAKHSDWSVFYTVGRDFPVSPVWRWTSKR
ncbi:hypothetical protein J6590_029079 [Homalodisca vitripennis]|nr:hypothetical protein J6590_029079 [Homalodisca vitripennis]